MMLRKPVSHFILLSLSIISFACVEDEVADRSYPSLDTKDVTEINSNGATFNAELLTTGLSGIADLGFVYDDTPNPTIDKADRISLGERSTKGLFSALANRNLIKDKKYFVRAYAIGKSNDIVVYGQQVEFVSQGGSTPEIKDFMPKDGVIGDTVVIVGSGFSDVIGNNLVRFGTVSARIIKIKPDSLWCEVPTSTIVGENELSYWLGQYTLEFEDKFTLNTLSISSFYPTLVTFGDTITIEGSNFPIQVDVVATSLLGKPSVVTSISPTKIKAIIGQDVIVPESEVSVQAGTQNIVTTEKIKLRSPEITSFSPMRGTKDTEVEIIGNNFSPVPTNNEVKIGELDAVVLVASATKLLVKIPNLVQGDYSFSINVATQVVTSENLFEIVGPLISSFAPISGTWGEILTITGRGFSNNLTDNIVKLGNTSCEVISATEHEVRILVPLNHFQKSSKLTVLVPSISAYEASSEINFTLNPPLIESISSYAGKSGDELTITGNDFHPNKENQIVKFGEFTAQVIEASKTQLRVVLPTKLVASNVKLSITHSEQTTFSTFDFNLISPWRKLKNFPSAVGTYGFGFSISDQGFVGVVDNGVNLFYRYDVASNTWVAKNSEFISPSQTVFVVDGKAWVGLPSGADGKPFSKEFSYYDPGLNSWFVTNDFPGLSTTLATGFSSNGFGYVTNGYVKSIYVEGIGFTYWQSRQTYRYSPTTGSWMEVASSPGALGYAIGRTYATAFTIGDKAFLFGGRQAPNTESILGDLLIYESSSDAWTQGNTPAPPKRWRAASFSINQTGYLIGGLGSVFDASEMEDFWSYDPLSDSWTVLESFPGTPRADAVVFVIGNKAYYGIGLGADGYLNDFWEFDPSKL